MVKKEFNSLGFNIVIEVPETVDEFDQLAKKQGACLNSAIFSELYRGFYNQFRAKLAELVENNTGIKRGTEVVLGKDGQPKLDDEKNEILRFTETEKVYLNRAFAQLVANKEFESVEAAAASYATLAQSVADSIKFDPSAEEAQPTQPKKIAKAYLTIAEKAQAGGKLESLATTLREKLANWVVEPTVESVARAISEDQRRKNAAKNLGGEYGV